MTHTAIMKTLLAKIEERARQRFACTTSGDAIDKIHSLASLELHDYAAIFLRRSASQSAGNRTLLVARLEAESELHAAVTWAATVRASLQEPETADLYLFLVVPNISDGAAARIEASEQFCRKYVAREEDDFFNTLNRSFLAVPNGDAAKEISGTSLTDPLAKALAETERDHEWFNLRQQQTWRSAFLSGAAGRDLAEQLLTDPISLDDLLS